MIRKQGSKWVVLTHDGSRVLGRHKTRSEAEAQLRAVEARKHNKDYKKYRNSGG